LITLHEKGKLVVSEIFDISLPLSSALPVWPGSPAFKLEATKSLSDGDICNESSYSANIHTGTHIDMPWHFLNDGCKTDSLDLERMIGSALVVWLPDIKKITPKILESIPIPKGTERLLFRTDNSILWKKGDLEFKRDFVALTVEAATWLVDAGVRLVGIDYLSIQLFGDSTQTHKILLHADIVILEGINLCKVLPGTYELICLPLAISGAEGAPARAILRK
jgi:arylformamidase